MKKKMMPSAVAWSSILLIAALAPAVKSFECSSNRPGWADHRTLYVPDSMLGDDDDRDNAWMAALCCVYTHVEVTTSSSIVQFEIYDGSDYDLGQSFSSFPEVAAEAMDEICGMSMGSADCRNQASCVEQGLTSTLAPTVAPTVAPEDMEEVPTMENVTKMFQDAINCNTDRPNSWASHRTLHVPENMLLPNTDGSFSLARSSSYNESNTVGDDYFITSIAWMDALCCVYTHVVIVPTIMDIVPAAQLERYDGYVYNLPGEDWMEVARNAMTDICDMSMGSQDCRGQQQCVNEAFVNTTFDFNDPAGGGERRTELSNVGEVTSSSLSSFLGHATSTSSLVVGLLLLRLWL
ncbi:expressed unknown protein [Seminavis robusta]|uniref:Uncharacterized protein n=1 Tax=Seminavis robusta TaxID=568900 RepID=A0A9N8F069_9STRA|nr:expressed unknown protein [Seminavis robusta]|eukprot:Sro2811_g337640.1 n/a (350) ;mRNA; r:9217-10266